MLAGYFEVGIGYTPASFKTCNFALKPYLVCGVC